MVMMLPRVALGAAYRQGSSVNREPGGEERADLSHAEFEHFLGWLLAIAYFAFFSWVVWMIAWPFFADRHARSEQLAEFRADPTRAVAYGLMFGGIMTFLYWLVAGRSLIGIDHIRPLGMPLGLIGFAVALVALWVISKREKP